MSELLVLEDFPFHFEIKTRWRDLDAFGHVNNATFLSYIEDARITFFVRWGINLKEKSNKLIYEMLRSLGFISTNSIFSQALLLLGR